MLKEERMNDPIDTTGGAQAGVGDLIMAGVGHITEGGGLDGELVGIVVGAGEVEVVVVVDKKELYEKRNNACF